MESLRNIALGIGVVGLLVEVVGCQGPEAFYRDGGDFGSAGAAGSVGPTGVAGTTGAGGTVTGAGGRVTGTGGSVAGTGGPTGGTGGGITGAAGTNGRGGTTGTGGSAAGTNGRGGTTGVAGTNGRGGTTGMGGGAAGTNGRGGTTGAAGTNGRGGSGGTSSGAAGRGGTTGAGGTSAAGTSGGGTPMVIFSDDFESYPAGTANAANWTRSGGSMGDWTFATDGTQVLEQNANLSSTPRTEYASGASGAPWSGALSVAARVKLLATGSSNQSAQVCLRYTNSSNYYCAALVPTGVQIQTAVGGSAGQSAVFTSTVAIGTWYDLKVSVDAAGLVSASLGGAVVGSYTPAALASGFAAVGTASMRAAFDNVVVTRP